MMTLLRSNNYLQSSHSRPEGCNGPVPSAAVAARSDLQWTNVTCSWQVHDYMVGNRPYGAIDAKVMSSDMSETLSFLAVAGPTTSNQPPFDWRSESVSSNLNQNVPIEKFDFQSEYVNWNDKFRASVVIEASESSSLVSELNFYLFATIVNISYFLK